MVDFKRTLSTWRLIVSHAPTWLSADVPVLEELVDPDCVPDFFCGLAANGSILMLPARQTRTGMRYTESLMRVQFDSMSAGKLQIVSKYLFAAGGPAAKVRVKSNEAHELAYYGQGCQAPLQVSRITN